MNHEVYVAVKDEHLPIHDTVIIMMTSWTFLENKALCFPPDDRAKNNGIVLYTSLSSQPLLSNYKLS